VLAWLVLPACEPPRADVVVGTLERDRLELVAEAPEPIVEIAVREGDRVEQDALLVRLEDRLAGAQLAEAEAARDRAKARLAELVRGTRPELVAEARAQVAQAASTLDEARSNLDRIEPLAADGVEPAARLDEARRRVGESEGRFDAARANLERLVDGATLEELDQARAAVDETEAALAGQRLVAERLVVRAPCAGVVDALPYEIGERPQAGATLVVLLAGGAPYARVYVPEPIRAGVRPGVAAQIEVDGRMGHLRGIVRRVSHEPTFTPYFALTEHDRSRLVYVAEVDLVDAEAQELPAGLPVVARFTGGGSDGSR
jgi:HlyD family secretion protein